MLQWKKCTSSLNCFRTWAARQTKSSFDPLVKGPPEEAKQVGHTTKLADQHSNCTAVTPLINLQSLWGRVQHALLNQTQLLSLRRSQAEPRCSPEGSSAVAASTASAASSTLSSSGIYITQNETLPTLTEYSITYSSAWKE